MTHPKQSDYGTQLDPSTLVPESLLAYRHFAVVDGELWPMNGLMNTSTNPYTLEVRPPRAWGFSVPDCTCPLCTPVTEGVRHPRTVNDTFRATCLRRLYSIGGYSQPQILQEPLPHPAPHKECKCGFYAHYDPDEDFYQGLQWYHRDPDRYHSRTGSLGSSTDRMIIVRAVVELSGRVVLGTKGVRAERMKIRALAPDWDKYSSYYEQDMVNDLYLVWPDIYSRPPGWAAPKPSLAEVRERVRGAMTSIARDYRIDLYEDARHMYYDHPRSNIDHLLKDAE